MAKNINETLKKAHQRLFLLKFNMNTPILVHLYRSRIESILTFSIVVWYFHLTETQKERLDKVVKLAKKIKTCLTSVESIYLERTNFECKKNLKDNLHPAKYLFEITPLLSFVVSSVKHPQ